MRPNHAALALMIVIAHAAFSAKNSAAQSAQSRVILVDEGGAYDVLVHPSFVTVLYLPDKIQKALSSDTRSYEILPVGGTSLAIRPLVTTAPAANLALATDTIKVSIVLRIATNADDAMTQVTFKRADVEAEVQKRIEAGVIARTAELQERITEMQRAMDAELPRIADGLIASRLLQRREARRLNAIERNDDNVVVEVTEVFYLGDDAYIIFAVENRRRAPYRLASVRVRDGETDHAGVVRFSSNATEAPGRGVIAVVAPGGKGKGVVAVRRPADVMGKRLTLSVAEPGGRTRVTVDQIVLR